MSLLSLPNEVILCVYDQIEYVDDANALSQTYHLLYSLINPTLFSRFIRENRYQAFQLAIDKGDHVLLQRLYEEDSGFVYKYGLTGKAAIYGHTELVRFVLDRNISDVYAADNPGAPLPLVQALLGGHLETARLLVARGADPDRLGPLDNSFYPFGYTALAAIAAKGPPESVRFLLNEAKPNLQIYSSDLRIDELFSTSRTHKLTPIYHLAERGNLEIVKCLIDAGFEVRGHSLCNPLLVAARNGHDDVVSFLLEKGEKEDANFLEEQISAADLLGLIRGGNRRIIQLLVSTDRLMKRITTADSSEVGLILVACVLAGNGSCVQYLLETEKGLRWMFGEHPRKWPFEYNEHAYESVVEAAKTGYAEMVWYFLGVVRVQAPPDLRELVIRVLFAASANNQLELLRDVLDSEHGKQLDPMTLEAALSKALWQAAPYYEVMRLLLERGAINAIDWDVDNILGALHDAICHGNRQAVELILELTGINPLQNLQNQASTNTTSLFKPLPSAEERRSLQRDNLLELAVDRNCKDGVSSLGMVRTLLETNNRVLKPPPTDELYQQALRSAVYKNDIDTVRYFLDLNIDPNWGRPLMTAVRSNQGYKKCDEMIKLILSYGAEVNVLDRYATWSTSLTLPGNYEFEYSRSANSKLPEHIEFDYSSFILVQALLDNGADPLSVLPKPRSSFGHMGDSSIPLYEYRSPNMPCSGSECDCGAPLFGCHRCNLALFGSIDDDADYKNALADTALWESLGLLSIKYLKTLLKAIEARGTPWDVDAFIRRVKSHIRFSRDPKVLKYLEQHRCRMMYPVSSFHSGS